ncbi:MAG: hypothetical protein ABI388_06050 [Bacteroidia bacterium]
MKKNIYLFCLFIILTQYIFAQNVGINSTGATPNASAMLDIVSTSGGLLVPRMTNAQKNAITVTATQDGLLVYQTDAGTQGIGFYYYSNAAAAWLPFLSGWALRGNLGTTAATNFMGSTDANDVVFKAGNNEVFRMGNSKTNLMVNSTGNTNAYLSSTTSGALHAIYSSVTGSSTGNAIYAESKSTTADAIVAIVTNSSSGSNAITADVSGGDGTGNAVSATSKGKVSYSTVYALNTPAAVAGTGFDITQSHHTVGAQVNLPTTTPSYAFAVHGEISGHSNPCGGVIGYYSPSGDWGALGYRNKVGSVNYGVYATTAAGNGTGRMSADGADNAANIGLGAYGDLFGGWIRGNIYGLAVKGERVSLYVDGKTIVNQPIMQLTKTADDKTIVNYTPASATADLQIHGLATMQNGVATVVLDETTLDQFTSKENLTIVATPTGQTNGVYVELRGNKLIIKENANGTSTTKVSWIIIGERNIIDNALPDEFKDKDFDANLKGFMHNENDKSTESNGLNWDGTKLNKVETPK